ncbi:MULTISPECIES: hypothetical protein [unclassified Aeromonas]|nr:MULTISPECIES: hypothetical protein [unclassified Aeromonas]
MRFVLVDDEVYLPKDDFIRVTRFCFISPDGDWRKVANGYRYAAKISVI